MLKNSPRSGERAAANPATKAPPKKRGAKPRLIVDFPEPRYNLDEDPDGFADALRAQLDRFGESIWYLHRSLERVHPKFNRRTLLSWADGDKVPRSVTSMAVLRLIEQRYQLPDGYFHEKLPNKGRAVIGRRITGIAPAERRRLAWHLPDDFDERSPEERDEIVAWVRDVIVSGSTEYRRFQREALKERYGLQFPPLTGRRMWSGRTTIRTGAGPTDAPSALTEEVRRLVTFKTATLSAIGYVRNGVWNDYTAAQRAEHLSLFFGALAASPTGVTAGHGVPRDHLCLALLAFPSVWDWYVRWRERRRGFFTSWEANMLSVGVSLVRRETGWLRQSPDLADRLQPIDGLVSSADIAAAKADWEGQCEAMYRHGLVRAKEIERVLRIHRDPFEPILPVLEAAKPVAEYLRIADEILKYRPDPDRFPLQAAESTRSFLMIRLGLHLGVRQRNLRELRLCPRGETPTGERQLEARRHGEIRWSDRDQGWEVLIPSSAFKNAGSSFFGNKPFRLILPDLGKLYAFIDSYVRRERALLLGNAADPETFFVKTAKRTTSEASYNVTTFYEAWRHTIQRHGVFNPYTGRGAIKGLLPHGPHNVRDVLATHILKQTGSYEQASYAIQDTPATVAEHYGRFLPQDKAAMAAAILNQVWEAA